MESTKIYVASSYADRDRSIELMKVLEGEGYEVTSTWLRHAESDKTFRDRQRVADLDVEDVVRADCLVAYTHDSRSIPRGALVEIGIAYGLKKPVIWWGNDNGECVFYYAMRAPFTGYDPFAQPYNASGQFTTRRESETAMSDSHKARHGTSCKHWKDTALASRSQKRAWSKTKQIKNQRDRTNAKASLRDEDRAE